MRNGTFDLESAVRNINTLYAAGMAYGCDDYRNTPFSDRCTNCNGTQYAHFSERKKAQAGLHRAAYSTEPAQRKLDQIVRAYDACKDDPEARIPQRLSLLLEAAKL